MWQLRHIDCDPARLVFGEQIGRAVGHTPILAMIWAILIAMQRTHYREVATEFPQEIHKKIHKSFTRQTTVRK
jgi:hypothetical protein